VISPKYRLIGTADKLQIENIRVFLVIYIQIDLVRRRVGMKTDGPVGIFNPGQLEFDGCEAPRSQNQGQANDENEFILR